VSIKKYYVIEFINDEADVMSVDCVPSKWVTFDEKTQLYMAKFMPPPYNKKTQSKLYNFIIKKYDAPEHWPSYPVRVRSNIGKCADVIILKNCSFINLNCNYNYNVYKLYIH